MSRFNVLGESEYRHSLTEEDDGYEHAAVFDVEADILDEATKDKLPKGVIMQVRGQFGHAGRVTSNGRLYTKKLMGREVKRIQDRIKRRAVHIISGHPGKGADGKPQNPDPDKQVGILTGLKMEADGRLGGSADILDTPSGRIYATKVRARAEVGHSSRGPGTETPIEYDDQHEEFDEADRKWVGRQVGLVGDDYHLKTFDHVVDHASDGAVVHNFNESEEDMGFDVKKLTEDDWGSILESDKVKKAVEEAAGKAVEEALKKHDDSVVKEETKKYLQSDEFIEDHFEVDDEKGEGDEDSPEFDEATCPECGGKMLKGGKFCPSCGKNVSKPKKESEVETENQKLTEQVEKLTEANKKLFESFEQYKKDRDQEKAEAEEAERIAGKVEEMLEAKPEAVVDYVVERLADKELDEESVEETVKDLIESAEKFVKRVGGSLEEGKAPGSRGGTREDDSDLNEEGKKDEVSEDLQALDDLMD
jgi:hypothetical protein